MSFRTGSSIQASHISAECPTYTPLNIPQSPLFLPPHHLFPHNWDFSYEKTESAEKLTATPNLRDFCLAWEIYYAIKRHLEQPLCLAHLLEFQSRVLLSKRQQSVS